MKLFTVRKLPSPLASELVGRASDKGTAWLDSSLTVGEKGKRSFFGHSPCAELRQKGDRIMLRRDGRSVNLPTGTGLFENIERLVSSEGWTAVGFVSYEAMLPFLGLEARVSSPIDDAAFFFYKQFREIQDSLDLDSAEFGEEDHIPAGRIMHEEPYERYRDNITRILDHIREGDIYQANYTCRFEIENDADPFTIYRQLRRLNPAPYASYLNFGDYQILSSSPEQMLFRDDKRLVSSPIKGTAPLGSDDRETARHREALLASAKDRAELLMIVDLVRNDLGRVARAGSVSVEELFAIEQYSSLMHLVARVSAISNDSANLSGVCRAIMPGGSITGAPKRRAVEIISQLETAPRSVYTGCIGYISPEKAEFNIAIRTMYTRDSVWYVHAGGGIVADSDTESEYREMLLKGRNLMRALGVER